MSLIICNTNRVIIDTDQKRHFYGFKLFYSCISSLLSLLVAGYQNVELNHLPAAEQLQVGGAVRYRTNGLR